MIDKVQRGSRRALDEMQVSVKRVSDGAELAHQAGNSISGTQLAAVVSCARVHSNPTHAEIGACFMEFPLASPASEGRKSDGRVVTA